MEARQRLDLGDVLVNSEVLAELSGATLKEYIQTYGWIPLLGMVVYFCLWRRLSPIVQRCKRKIDELMPQTDRSRHEAMEAARQKMVSQLEEQAAGLAMTQKEEQHVSTGSLKTKKEIPLRTSDYRPLWGRDAPTWRPRPRRGGGGDV